MENFYLKDVKITCCNLENSSEKAISYVESGKKHYVCVTDAGNLVNAHRKSPGLKKAINNSFISLPDGRPISILAKLKGIKNIERVTGHDFMLEIFRKTYGKDISHFFLGDTDETLEVLKNKLTGKFKLKIAGSFSPVFGEWDDYTDEEIILKINESNADFIWVSLGGGKQEIWMENNYLKLNKGIMTGVGAAFRFITGDIKRAPLTFQHLGFEWLFRLIQQPGKMFKRYSTTLPFFLIYSTEEFFKTNTNK